MDYVYLRWYLLAADDLQEFLFSCGAAPHPNCSLGFEDREDTYHVFISCDKRKDKRATLIKQFQEKKIEFNLKNIFKNDKTQLDVEKFIKELF